MGRPSKWDPEEVKGALRASRTRAEAAGRLGTTVNGLDKACAILQLGKPSAHLGRDIPPPPPRVPEPDPGPVPAPDSPPVREIDWTGARSTSTAFERRVILGDLHIPFHDLNACAVVLAAVRALQPHTIVQLGDYFNMGAVSHHPRPYGGRENHQRAAVMGRSFLDALRRAAPAADIHLIWGNHDRYGSEYADENPQFAGMLEAESLLRPQDFGVRVHASRSALVLGPVSYRHGYGGGTHYCQRYAQDDGPQDGVLHMKVAHHHSMQRFHAKNGVECWGAGWLGESHHETFHYAKNPRHWERGFLVEDVAGDLVTTYPVKILGRKALLFGRLIVA